MKNTILLFIMLLPIFATAQGVREKNLHVVDDPVSSLSADDKRIWKERAEEKLRELQNYIVTIGDKKQANQDRDLAVQSAAKLFIPEARMEVSNVNTKEVKSYPIKVYLSRLKALPYANVVITFYQVAYISNLQLAADGKYYATATIFQEFKGYSGDVLAYTDKTTKTVQLVLQFVDNEFYQKKMWELMLGDVKVAETRKA